jgi:hypothetical protein
VNFAHVAKAEPNPAVAGWWLSFCSCGWIGPDRLSEADAADDAARHVEGADE